MLSFAPLVALAVSASLVLFASVVEPSVVVAFGAVPASSDDVPAFFSSAAAAAAVVVALTSVAALPLKRENVLLNVRICNRADVAMPVRTRDRYRWEPGQSERQQEEREWEHARRVVRHVVLDGKLASTGEGENSNSSKERLNRCIACSEGMQ